MIRILVPYSPTLFYHDRGRQRGIIAEAGAELEKYLNKKYPEKRTFTVVLIPTTRDRLFQSLIDGEGDIVAGSVTITPARLERFDFTTPTFRGINQVMVTGPEAPELHSLDDLAGQTVYVRKSKSFCEHLLELNERFEHPDPPRRPLPPMIIYYDVAATFYSLPGTTPLARDAALTLNSSDGKPRIAIDDLRFQVRLFAFAP
jgi:ABC-type amino acid transport substrate-binding protein